MKYDSMIFDLDGTLWDSTETSAKVWRQILTKYPEITDEVTSDRLKSLFGKPLREIGVELFQSVNKEKAIEVIEECCREQSTYIAQMGGILYPELEHTLKLLSQKYKLFIVSNCEDGYIESFYEAHGLQEYFTDYECPGRTGKLKADNIKIIIERNNLQAPVYIGDTLGDAQAAKEAGVPFIYASYGFGKVEEFVDQLDKFSDLLKYL